jgi:hypothetical protein
MRCRLHADERTVFTFDQLLFADLQIGFITRKQFEKPDTNTNIARRNA